MGQILEKFQDERRNFGRIEYELPNYHAFTSKKPNAYINISSDFKLQGKEWKERQIRLISDKVFDRVKNDTGKATLTFEELYIAVLLVYNDINKRLPGPHFDPPTKEQIRNLMRESDLNLDGELDREEFMKFIRRITKDTFVTVSQGLIITLAVAPTVALLTKRTTENVPGVGKVVQKIPNSLYASLVTLVIVAFQQGAERA